MSILNKYKRWKPMLHIVKDEYLDFVLSLDNTESLNVDGQLTKRCLISFIDTDIEDCIDGNRLSSMQEYTWENCVNDNAKLEDIGYTAMDNGFIHFEKDIITNDEFYELFANSKLETESYGNRFILNPITGNTGQFSYDYNFVGTDKIDYYALKGGFFQGFYKLHGFDYQVLPNRIENAWHMEFVIRPQDYETKDNILNSRYPENSGIFFYMGTRAENKFAQFYNSDINDYPINIGVKQLDYCDKLLCRKEPEENNKQILSSPCDFTLWTFLHSHSDCLDEPLFQYSSNKKKEINDDNESDTVCDTEDMSDFLKDDMCLSNIKLTMSDGKPIDETGYYEITTDNKYLIFNRTCDGFTTKTWNDENQMVLTGYRNTSKANLFLLLNRSCNGYTVHNLEKYYKEEDESMKYKVHRDIMNNAFALRVTEDGRIGYKYLVKDCDNEQGFSIKEEYSFPNMVQKNQWSTINVKFQILNGYYDNCGEPIKGRKMRIYIYVNGYLKFVSKELDEFDFRELNDSFDKQEGVPFNISLGGGTQGLGESIWIDYYRRFDKLLPIEQNFAGTFIGDFKSFKFYDCSLQYNEVKNNFLFEKTILNE